MEQDLTGRVLAGRFQLLSPLGEGGYGAVYLANQVTMGRKVAVKVINPKVADTADFVERFEREARVASRLQHPNTVVYFDFGQDADIHFLAMEFVEGRTLSQEIERSGSMSLARTAHLAIQICGALGEAHDVGMVHRDLKPANILLTERGGDPDFVKVIDFGLAKIVQGEHESSLHDLTEKDVILGTPAYMAPEQIRGRDVDNRSDIYALGVILFVMLTGKKPYDGDTPLGTAVMHLTEEIPLVRSLNPGVPETMEALVCWCMAKDKADRPASVQVVADELLTLLEESGEVVTTGKRRRYEPRPVGPSTTTLDPTPSTRSGKQIGARLAVLEADPNVRTVHPRRAATPGSGVSRTLLVVLIAALVLAGGVTYYVASQSGRGPAASAAVDDERAGDEPASPSLTQRGAIADRGTAAEPAAGTDGAPAVAAEEPTTADPTLREDAAPDNRVREAVAEARLRLAMDLIESRVAAQSRDAEAAGAEVAEVPGPEETAPHGSSSERSGGADGERNARHTPRERDPMPAATTGRLRLNAIPYGRVYCNGHPYGRTPIDEEVPVGRYECRIVSPGDQEVFRSIRVEGGAGELVQVRFDR